MEIVPRFLKSPKQSFFLFGPCGTGKSTWVKREFPDALWVDPLDLETYRLYSSRLGGPDVAGTFLSFQHHGHYTKGEKLLREEHIRGAS